MVGVVGSSLNFKHQLTTPLLRTQRWEIFAPASALGPRVQAPTLDSQAPLAPRTFRSSRRRSPSSRIPVRASLGLRSQASSAKSRDSIRWRSVASSRSWGTLAGAIAGRRRSRLRTRDLDLGLGPRTPSPDSEPLLTWRPLAWASWSELQVTSPSLKSRTAGLGLGALDLGLGRANPSMRPSRPLLQDSPSGTWDSSGNPPTRRPSRKLPSRTWDSECKLESRPPSLRFDETLSSHLKHGHAGGRST